MWEKFERWYCYNHEWSSLAQHIVMKEPHLYEKDVSRGINSIGDLKIEENLSFKIVTHAILLRLFH